MAHLIHPRLPSLTFYHRKSLYLGLAIAYGRPFAFALFLKIVQDCLAFLQPQLLRRLLSFITDYQEAREGLFGERPTPLIGFAYAFLMFFASIVQTVILHQVRCLTFCVVRSADWGDSISKESLRPAFEFVPGLSPLFIKRL